MKSILIAALAAVLLLSRFGEAKRVGDLEGLLHKDTLKDILTTYCNTMDAIAALVGTGVSVNDSRVVHRVEIMRDIFCPDTEFQGWTATGGTDGATQMFSRYRDSFDPVTQTPSLVTVYRDILPGYFGNSSQHSYTMPLITLGYRADGRLYAEFNATLRQTVNLRADPEHPLANNQTEIMGRYNHEFLYLDPPSDRSRDSYWCMRRFNSFNSFSFSFLSYVYRLTPQNVNDAQLGSFVRPGAL